MRLVEKVLYKAVSVALADTGCTEDFVHLVVQFGLVEARRACRKVLLA